MLGINVLLVFIIAAFIMAQIYIAKGFGLLGKGRAETIMLSTVKYQPDIRYYDYRGIKDNAVPIRLDVNAASIAVDLEKTADLADGAISFWARGDNGTEKIAVILRDSNNHSNANRDDVILTPPLPRERWQLFNIKLGQLSLPLDKAKISQVRFDTSDNLTENGPARTVYIKKIVIE